MEETTVGWFPVFTLLLGYAAKTFADWVQHRRTSELERAARAEARQDQLFERRTTFQRQTLLDLQDTIMQLMRTTGQMHHQDLMDFRKTGEWHKQLYPEEVSEIDRLANARTTVLAVRVSDESVRGLVAAVKDHATKVGISRSKEACELEMDAAMVEFERLNQRVGEVLRELDDDNSANILPTRRRL
jgi:hypothetical protein